ncbi:MAG: glycosyltransferase family 2 protein [Clostridia bacterium]|nr:glycosyltransferase family 2 protein [Clostridia bacterium]
MYKISVIIPAYNAEKYVRDCMDSVLNQTFTDFEVICVDDGSTDSTPEILDEYSKLDNRVKVIYQENGGVSKARNAGVEKCSGEYIAFIDADDRVTESYLEFLYEACKIYSSDISVVHAYYWNLPLDAKGDLNSIKCYSGTDALERFAVENSDGIWACWGKLVKAEIVKAYPFPEGRNYSEDGAVVYKWLWKAEKVADSNSYIYVKRHTESMLSQKYDESRLAMFDTAEEIVCFSRENNLPVLEKLYPARTVVSALTAYLVYDDSRLKKLFYDGVQKIIKENFKRWRNVKSVAGFMSIYVSSRDYSVSEFNRLILDIYETQLGADSEKVRKACSMELKSLAVRHYYRFDFCNPLIYAAVSQHYPKLAERGLKLRTSKPLDI